MFNSDMTVQNWTDSLTNSKNLLKNALDNAYATWAQWNNLVYGLDVSGIIGGISPFGTRTAEDVTKINTGFNDLKEIYDVANGNTAVSSPYNFMGPLAPFK